MSKTKPENKERANAELRKLLYDKRSCGECRVCCTTHGVNALDKGEDEACQFMGKPDEPGCSRYETRPHACAEYACLWRSGSDVLWESERPDKLGIVVDAKTDWLLTIKEAVPGGHEKAMDTIIRLSRKRIVLVLEKYGKKGTAFGPSERLPVYLMLMKQARAADEQFATMKSKESPREPEAPPAPGHAYCPVCSNKRVDDPEHGAVEVEVG